MKKKSPSNTDAPDPTMLAYLRSRQMDSLGDYLNRGRALKHASSEKLKARWAELMREWVKNFDGMDHREREDIEAELKMRDVELPMELVDDVVPVLRQLAMKTAEEVREADPNRKAEIEKQLRSEIANLTSPDTKKTN